MNGFVLESLYQTGWRRASEIHWRLCDAEASAKKAILNANARAVRILPLSVSSDAVSEIDAATSPKKKRACDAMPT